MRKSTRRQPIPPGLKTQIVFAVLITLGAMIVLPSALSAGKSADASDPGMRRSAGTVVISTRTFVTADFTADAYNDWQR